MVERVGIQEDLDKAVALLGYKESSGVQTDIVYLAAGIVVGTLFGSLSIHIGNVPVELSTSGGALIAGLVFGWMRGIHPGLVTSPLPRNGCLPNWDRMCLLPSVGLSASEGFLQGLKEEGLTLFLAGRSAKPAANGAGTVPGKVCI